MKDKEPHFALEAGIAALRWLIAGYGYDITGLDIPEPCRFALEAATNIGCLQDTKDRIRKMVTADKSIDQLAGKIISRELDRLAQLFENGYQTPL